MADKKIQIYWLKNCDFCLLQFNYWVNFKTWRYMDEITSEKFIREVVDLFKSAKKNLVTAVNMTMVYSYLKLDE